MFSASEFNYSSECNKSIEFSSLYNGVFSKFSLGIFASKHYGGMLLLWLMNS